MNPHRRSAPRLATPFAAALVLVLALALFVSSVPPLVYAASPNIVISQVYGGGGGSGYYLNDYVELFNLGATATDIGGWSVQYGSATGNFGSSSTSIFAFPPSTVIQPGKYLFVQLGSAGTAGIAFPITPDLTTTNLNMSQASGKVALANVGTALGCGATATPCTLPDSRIVDLVSYGASNNGEGGTTVNNGIGLTNQQGGGRKQGGCQDSDNNNGDFDLLSGSALVMRNSSTQAHSCAGSTNPSGIGAATPNTLFAGDSTLLTVAVTPGSNPTSTGLTVSCDLSAIGGSPTQAFYDDGTNGDATAGDKTFSYSAAVAANTSSGAKTLACTASDAQSRTGSTTITLTVTAVQAIGAVNGPVLDSDDGSAHRSTFAPPSGNGSGLTVVTVQGVIYEKTLQAINGTSDTYKGFFIQNTTATADGDPNTSDGLFVYMNKNDTLVGGYAPQVGNEVVISGKISEYYYMTEMTSASLVKVVRSNVDVDDEVAPVVANPPANLADANRYWERLQGMRVQVPQNSLVLGGRNVFSPADAEIWVARPDSTIAQRQDPYARRAFRDAHPLDDNYAADSWDGNGYRMLMGSLGIKAAVGDAQALIDPARTFDTVTNAPSGGLNYTFSKYRIEISGQPTFSQGPDPTQNNLPQVFDRNNHYSVVDYNLENLYDYRNNPFSGCDFAGDAGCPKVGPFLADVKPPYDYVPASDDAYQARLTDIAKEIINDLHSPDILMVQEVENQDICGTADGYATFVCGTTDNADGKPDVLQDLVIKIHLLGGPAYDAAFDRDSSDLRGIAPAFLYRTDRVQLLPPAGDPVLGANPAIAGFTSVPYDGDVSNPKTLNAELPANLVDTKCETSWIFPRAPDVGLFRIYSTSIGVGSYRDVYVINNHFKSGPDSCVPQRTEQAKYNAALVAFIQAANPNARIILGGDLNVYPRPDDPFAPIGQPTSSDQLSSLYDPALGLKNLWEVLLGQAPESAYSYVYLGQAQTLDQIFVNQKMLADLNQFRIAHINSDFPADYPGDVARGTSDHDPNVANFSINDAPTADAGGPYTVDEGSSVTLPAKGTDPEGQPITYAWDLDNDGTFETTGQSVTFSAEGLDGPSTAAVAVQVIDNTGLTAVAETTVTINNVAPTVNAVAITPAPSAEGASVVASVTGSDPAGILDAPFTCTVDYGDGSGALAGKLKGNSCTGPAHSYSAFGTYTVTVSVTDKDSGTGSNTASHSVIFKWSGFFLPVNNWPTVNIVRAGTSVPVKFGLGGNKGLAVLAASYPQSQAIKCAGGTPLGSAEPTSPPGLSGLLYNWVTRQYTYMWKTDNAWAGTCRKFTVTLVDGTVHQALFRFTRY